MTNIVQYDKLIPNRSETKRKYLWRYLKSRDSEELIRPTIIITLPLHVCYITIYVLTCSIAVRFVLFT